MTREEVIEQLENTILLIKQNGKDWWDDRDIPVLEEAIKAMKAVPCNDAVNRQDVLDLLQMRYSSKALYTFIYNLPIAFPKPTWGPAIKTGKWEREYLSPTVYADIFSHCSVCGFKTDHLQANFFNYCPNCGAKMLKEEQKDECLDRCEERNTTTE